MVSFITACQGGAVLSAAHRSIVVHVVERMAVAVRHSRWLERADGSGRRCAPSTTLCIRRRPERAREGHERHGQNPRPACCRGVKEEYEPDLAQPVSEFQPGDTFVDVGTYIGFTPLPRPNVWAAGARGGWTKPGELTRSLKRM